LKPAENRRVRSVASESYPLNRTCAHPECDRPTDDPHHAFPRSAIGGSSYFVEIETNEDYANSQGSGPKPIVIPHVTGLCRPHHEAVEIHQAWIRLEDNVWQWYYRNAAGPPGITDEEMWQFIGPLNPQPGSVEAGPKKKPKPEHQPAAPRAKAVKSVRVPKDALEDGLDVLEGLFTSARERLAPEMGWSSSTPDYYIIVAVFADWLSS
jgi:hypothetical protein